MSNNVEYEKLLETEEKKHKKIVKYDVEIGVFLILVVIVISIANLVLKSNYSPIKEVRAGIGPVIMDCNKDILNAAETFRKNATDSLAVSKIDHAKIANDEAILYYGKTMKKGMEEGLVVAVLDSCFSAANNFRVAIESQSDLAHAGLTVQMLNTMDNNVLRLRMKIDSLISGFTSYNAGGFFLNLSAVTPYPGKIVYTHPALPEVTPYREPPPPEPAKK